MTLRESTSAASRRLHRFPPYTARLPKWARSLLREPFFQFIVIGLLVWSGVENWHSRHDRHVIQLGPAARQHLSQAYLRQFGQPPSPQQMRGLIDRNIRDEIFLREGLAFNLDKDDEIIRRRIIQKYEFLRIDLAAAAPPTADMLSRWFDQNKLKYRTPERVAFTQVYFTVDKDGEVAAKSRALKVLQKLRGAPVDRAPDLGDSFPGPSDVSSLTPDEATRLFGDSELTNRLFELAAGQWSGPYRSGYGWHLVYIVERVPPTLPTLTQVRAQVLADYLDEQRSIANERAFETLRAKYTIQYDGAGS